MDGRAEHGDSPARNVLVVEDNEDLRSLIVSRLRRAGYHVRDASLGREAAEKAFERPGTVLLIDHNLPDMSGQELIAVLKERAVPPPFVIMTGQGDEQLAVRMMKLGAFDYLVKNSELLDKLQETLGRLFGELETERRILEDRSILLDNIRTQVWYLIGDHTYGAGQQGACGVSRIQAGRALLQGHVRRLSERDCRSAPREHEEGIRLRGTAYRRRVATFGLR